VDYQLKGKLAFLTAGAHGIGEAIADLLIEEGAQQRAQFTFLFASLRSAGGLRDATTRLRLVARANPTLSAITHSELTRPREPSPR
jgi:hypothetical protein